MKLKPARVIIFCRSVPVMMEFYSLIADVSESYIESDLKWGELRTGNMNIAFHYSPIAGKTTSGFKLVFFTKQIAAARKELTAMGVNMGQVIKSGRLRLCNGRDPEGNVFQISNRE